MDDAFFGSECGLANIRVPVLQSANDDIGFGGHITHR